MSLDQNCGQEVKATCGLFLAAQSLIGFGLGLLVAERLGRKARQTTAIATVSAGVAASLPLVIEIFAKRINDPGSARGVRRRLRSIREGEGEGFHHDEPPLL